MELIIMAILAGIVSLINNQKKKNEEPAKVPTQQKTQPSGPSQSSSSSPEHTSAQSRKERIKNARDAFDQRAKDLAQEYENQRSDKERAKPQKNLPSVKKVEAQVEDLTVSLERSRPERAPSNRKKIITSNTEVNDLPIKNGLNEKDLVNGIVMAEILGPPRSKRPHSKRMSR